MEHFIRAAIDEAVRFIRIIAPTFGLMGWQMILTGTMRGAGDTKFVTWLTFILAWPDPGPRVAYAGMLAKVISGRRPVPATRTVASSPCTCASAMMSAPQSLITASLRASTSAWSVSKK